MNCEEDLKRYPGNCYPECSGDPRRVWMGERFYLVLEDVSVVTVEGWVRRKRPAEGESWKLHRVFLPSSLHNT